MLLGPYREPASTSGAVWQSLRARPGHGTSSGDGAARSWPTPASLARAASLPQSPGGSRPAFRSRSIRGTSRLVGCGYVASDGESESASPGLGHRGLLVVIWEAGLPFELVAAPTIDRPGTDRHPRRAGAGSAALRPRPTLGGAGCCRRPKLGRTADGLVVADEITPAESP